MSDLMLCCGCARHLRREERHCPFCGAAVTAETRGASPRVASRGLSRARLYAFNAAVATGVAAGTATGCGSKLAVSPSNDASFDASGGSSGGSPGTGAAEAGADAPDVDGSVDAIADQTVDQTADSGVMDASNRDWGPIPTPYGCVFPGACGDFKV